MWLFSPRGNEEETSRAASESSDASEGSAEQKPTGSPVDQGGSSSPPAASTPRDASLWGMLAAGIAHPRSFETSGSEGDEEPVTETGQERGEDHADGEESSGDATGVGGWFSGWGGGGGKEEPDDQGRVTESSSDDSPRERGDRELSAEKLATQPVSEKPAEASRDTVDRTEKEATSAGREGAGEKKAAGADKKRTEQKDEVKTPESRALQEAAGNDSEESDASDDSPSKKSGFWGFFGGATPRAEMTRSPPEETLPASATRQDSGAEASGTSSWGFLASPRKEDVPSAPQPEEEKSSPGFWTLLASPEKEDKSIPLETQPSEETPKESGEEPGTSDFWNLLASPRAPEDISSSNAEPTVEASSEKAGPASGTASEDAAAPAHTDASGGWSFFGMGGGATEDSNLESESDEAGKRVPTIHVASPEPPAVERSGEAGSVPEEQDHGPGGRESGDDTGERGRERSVSADGGLEEKRLPSTTDGAEGLADTAVVVPDDLVADRKKEGDSEKNEGERQESPLPPEKKREGAEVIVAGEKEKGGLRSEAGEEQQMARREPSTTNTEEKKPRGGGTAGADLDGGSRPGETPEKGTHDSLAALLSKTAHPVKAKPKPGKGEASPPRSSPESALPAPSDSPTGRRVKAKPPPRSEPTAVDGTPPRLSTSAQSDRALGSPPNAASVDSPPTDLRSGPSIRQRGDDVPHPEGADIVKQQGLDVTASTEEEGPPPSSAATADGQDVEERQRTGQYERPTGADAGEGREEGCEKTDPAASGFRELARQLSVKTKSTPKSKPLPPLPKKLPPIVEEDGEDPSVSSHRSSGGSASSLIDAPPLMSSLVTAKKKPPMKPPPRAATARTQQREPQRIQEDTAASEDGPEGTRNEEGEGTPVEETKEHAGACEVKAGKPGRGKGFLELKVPPGQKSPDGGKPPPPGKGAGLPKGP
ncbi:hypothetical protein CSUI_004657, partial [Cystoisospora suis]